MISWDEWFNGMNGLVSLTVWWDGCLGGHEWFGRMDCVRDWMFLLGRMV